MTAALATIVFLVAGWIALVVIAGSLNGRLGRMSAALRRHQPADALAMSVPVRARYSPRRPRVATIRPHLRAAA